MLALLLPPPAAPPPKIPFEVGYPGGHGFIADTPPAPPPAPERITLGTHGPLKLANPGRFVLGA